MLPLVAPIVPFLRDQPFDDPVYRFEPKYDGFRGPPRAGKALVHGASVQPLSPRVRLITRHKEFLGVTIQLERAPEDEVECLVSKQRPICPISLDNQ